jgi:hypothetical protein
VGCKFFRDSKVRHLSDIRGDSIPSHMVNLVQSPTDPHGNEEPLDYKEDPIESYESKRTFPSQVEVVNWWNLKGNGDKGRVKEENLMQGSPISFCMPKE